MTNRRRLAAIAAVLAFPMTACGNGFLGIGRSSASYYREGPAQPALVYYYVCPVYVAPSCRQAIAPSPFAATQPPLPAAPNVPPKTPTPQNNTTFATPKAAPPSSGPVSGEPPLAVPARPRAPAVNEPGSYYQAYPVAVQDPARRFGERCSIEFWNLTNKDLTLKVDGQSRSLAHGKSLVLDVRRRFTWQIEGREANQENIAMGESALEIVIRR